MNQDPLSLAQLIGYGAMCCSVASFGFKSNRNMNKMMAVTNFFWVMHFGLLGALAGALNLGVSAFRSLLFVSLPNEKRRLGMFSFFIAIYTLLGIIFIKHAYDLLPLFASYAVCFGLFIFTGIKTKLGFITANTCLFFYSYCVFSIGGMISMTAGIILGLFTIWRIIKVKPVPPT